jgi:hypothetical protein
MDDGKLKHLVCGRSDASEKYFMRPAHSVSCRGIKIVLIMMETLWKYDLKFVKLVLMVRVNSIIILHSCDRAS